MFYLGEAYEGVYFTKREAECLMHMLQGNTIVATAKMLQLSPRTVEFYVKNMKMKIGVTTKAQLLQKVEHTDFVKNYHFKVVTTGAALPVRADSVDN